MKPVHLSMLITTVLACAAGAACSSAPPQGTRPPASAAQDTKGSRHLFILSGQSNMAGLDPKISFTPAVIKAFGEDRVLIIKDAHGGQSIRSWCKSNHEFPPPTVGRVPKVRGELYVRLMNKTKAAIKGEVIQTATLVWMQGESDLRNTAYDAYLGELLQQLQVDLKRTDINLVIGRISDAGLDQKRRLEGRKYIRRTQVEFAESWSRGTWVDTDDLNDRKQGGKIVNDLHYTAEGYRVLGQRFADQAISLIRTSSRVQSVLKLVPYPQELAFQSGALNPGEALSLRYDQENLELCQTATTCTEDLTQLGFTVFRDTAGLGSRATTVELALQEDKSLGSEGYRLTIGAKIAITAATDEGLFWGTRTLLQILHAGPRKPLPHLTITDQPEFAYRGLMIDNARSFHSIGFHLKTIKRLAAFKLNRYHIHFSDQQSYTLPSAKFPGLPTPDRHYSRAQVKRLVAAAKQYHVMIIPEIDVPGHAAALACGIKNLGCTNVVEGKVARKLCIGKESTYATLATLFAEVMEMIPGDYWHLGADEVRYDGRGCEACAKRMQTENLTAGTQLFHYFINRMHGIVKAKGRRMLAWEGFSPVLPPLVDKDVIVCPFDIKHRGHMPRDYFNAGYTVLNTSWTPLYVADKLYMTTPEVIARWSPYMFGAGRSPQPFAYWKKFKPEEYRGKVIGAQVCSWANEEKAEEGLLFGTGRGFPDYGRPAPRLQIMAERVWTGSKTTYRDLLERVGERYW